MTYNQRFSQRKVKTKSAPFVNNEKDLDEVVKELGEIIFSSKLDEYFLINIDKLTADLKEFYKTYETNKKENQKIKESIKSYDFANYLTNFGAKSYGVEVNIGKIGNIYYTKNIREKEFIDKIITEANKVNANWRKKANGLVNDALVNFRNTVKYHFLELKNFKCVEKNPLVENYFTVFDEKNRETIFANNGWLYGVEDTTENFALYGSWKYFQRGVVIWADCPKLR